MAFYNDLLENKAQPHARKRIFKTTHSSACRLGREVAAQHPPSVQHTVPRHHSERRVGVNGWRGLRLRRLGAESARTGGDSPQRYRGGPHRRRLPPGARDAPSNHFEHSSRAVATGICCSRGFAQAQRWRPIRIYLGWCVPAETVLSATAQRRRLVGVAGSAEGRSGSAPARSRPATTACQVTA